MSKDHILRVGTDCSGIEAPIQALIQLKIPFKHVFSSEIDKYCIQSILANYEPEIMFEDISERDIEDVPDIDLYVCGFPCQVFSYAGERKGFEDKRGNVFFSCLEVIKTKQPTYFILENVKGLLSHDKKKTWNVIWNLLSSLSEDGYNVKWKILNTKDYGIPQNRERVYIVGCKNKDFEWPEKMPMDNINNYVDINDQKVFTSKTIEKYKHIISDNSIFLNTDFLKYTNFPTSDKVCPCVGAQSTLWCSKIGRYANVNEYLKLQGFDIDSFKRVVNTTQLKKQAGNSMSVNVLKEIFKKIL